MPESNTPINNQPEPVRFVGIQVEIACEPPFPVDETSIRSVVTAIVRDAGYQNAEISVAIVDDQTIHQLNRTYLDHDYETDVLSFTLEIDEENSFIAGEVVVSKETATRQAAEFGWPVASELLLYLIHGTLHLVGFDDKDEVKRSIMRNEEKKYLRQMSIEIPESKLPGASEVDEV